MLVITVDPKVSIPSKSGHSSRLYLHRNRGIRYVWFQSPLSRGTPPDKAFISMGQV